MILHFFYKATASVSYCQLFQILVYLSKFEVQGSELKMPVNTISKILGVKNQRVLMRIYMEELRSWRIHPSTRPKNDPDVSFISPFFSNSHIFQCLSSLFFSFGSKCRNNLRRNAKSIWQSDFVTLLLASRLNIIR